MRRVTPRLSGFINDQMRRRSALLAFTAVVLLNISCGTSGAVKTNQVTGPIFSNASLHGNYMYRLAGTFYGSSGNGVQYEEAGTLIADGNGNLTGGVDDFVQGASLTSGPITGTYSISRDGTGVVTATMPRGPVTLAITLVSSSSFYLIEFDSSASGDGEALLQNPAAFGATPSGAFVFRLNSSQTNGPMDVVRIGQMTVSNGSVTGVEDVVRAGVPGSSTLTGSMSAPDESGRGMVVLTESGHIQSNYIYYVLDSNTLKFLDADAGVLGGGRADAQSSTPFSNASLKGGFVFRARGGTLTHAFGANSLGLFVSDGNGNILSGNYDSVQDGTPISSGQMTGNYQVDANGRSTITLNPQGASSVPLIAWMVNSSEGLLFANSPDLQQDGRLDQQRGSSFSAASLHGRYAFYSFGSQSQSSPWLVRVGVMSFDGNQTVTFDNYFANHSGDTAQNGPVSGKYFVSPNGRVYGFTVGSVSTQTIYLVSGRSGSLMLSASGSALAGSLALQTSP